MYVYLMYILKCVSDIVVNKNDNPNFFSQLYMCFYTRKQKEIIILLLIDLKNTPIIPNYSINLLRKSTKKIIYLDFFNRITFLTIQKVN